MKVLADRSGGPPHDTRLDPVMSLSGVRRKTLLTKGVALKEALAPKSPYLSGKAFPQLGLCESQICSLDCSRLPAELGPRGVVTGGAQPHACPGKQKELSAPPPRSPFFKV